MSSIFCGARDARVVDEDVDRAERRFDSVDQARDLGGDRDIGLDRDRSGGRSIRSPRGPLLRRRRATGN